jgi:hypothetical protein
MTLYTVEATTASTSDFRSLRRFTDIVPGTFLLEDPEEPTLVFPVDANSAMAAVRFIEGVAKLGELDVVRGCVYEAPVGEFEVDQSEEEVDLAASPVVDAVRTWMSHDEPLLGRIDDRGRLVDA